MEAIKCELCGSNDLVKKDGVYVCQYCGTQYTIEDARNLLRTAEGGVDVSGSTVKVDNTGFVKKYLENARRAKAKEDWVEVEKYYNMVEQNDPSNIEAIFYSAYGKVMQSLVEVDIYKREAAFKPFINSISIVDDNFNFEKIDEQIELLKQMSDSIFAMTSSSYVYLTKKNGYGIKTYDDSSSTKVLFKKVHLGFIESLDNIAAKLDKETATNALIEVCELIIKHCEASGQSTKARDSKLLVNKLDSSRYSKDAYWVQSQKKAAEKALKEREATLKEREANNRRRSEWVKKHWAALTVSILAVLIVGAFSIKIGIDYANESAMNSMRAHLTSNYWGKEWQGANHYLRFDENGTFYHCKSGWGSGQSDWEECGTYSIERTNGAFSISLSAMPDTCIQSKVLTGKDGNATTLYSSGNSSSSFNSTNTVTSYLSSSRK